MAILEGSVYSCDLKDLAFVSNVNGKSEIVLIYKQGANITISLSSMEERDRQYKDLISLWKKARNSSVADQE